MRSQGGRGDDFEKMSSMPLPTEDQITEALRSVIDPELRRSIVELEMVRSIDIHPDGRVDVVVSLTTPGCPIRAQFERAVVDNVSKVAGVTSVGVGFDVLSDTEKQGLQQKLGRPGGLPEGALAKVKNVICVASGKGGVGKSTMTANLAPARSIATSTATRSRGCSGSTAVPRSTPSARSCRSIRRAASR